MRKKFDKWKNLFLLKGGWLTLAQSVITSLLFYFFSVLKALTRVIKEIKKLTRNFWGDFERGVQSPSELGEDSSSFAVWKASNSGITTEEQ